MTGKPPSDRRLATALAIALFGVYLFFYSGTFKNAADEWFMYALADSLARNASLDVDQMAHAGEYKGLAKLGPDGHLYSKYSPVQSALAAPLLWLGRAWPDGAQSSLALLTNAAVTAATAALVFGAARRLGYARVPALSAALSYGLLSPALVYAKTFTSEPSTALGLALALYALAAYRTERTARWAAVAGAALGLIAVSKAASAAAIPGALVGLGLVNLTPRPPSLGRKGESWLEYPSGNRARSTKTAHPKGTPFLPREGGRGVRSALAFLLPLLLAGGVALAYNAARFGDPLQTGYTEADGSFTAPLWFSLPALLVSPVRGIVWYAPVLWLAAFGAVGVWRRDWRWAITLAAMAGPFAVIYAAWHGWHGGLAAWGPRYWVPLLPALCLLLPEAFQRLGRPSVGLAWLAAVAVLGLSGLIQVSAAGFNYLGYIDETGTARRIDLFNEDEAMAQLAWEVRASPLLHQPRFMTGFNSDVFWLRQTADGRWLVEPAAGLAAGLTVAAGIAVALIAARRFRQGPVAGAIAFALIAVLVVIRAQSRQIADTNSAWSAAVRQVDAAAQPGDVLVTGSVAPLTATFAWLKSGVEHYGLAGIPAGAPLDRNTARFLALADDRRGALWNIYTLDRPGAVDQQLGNRGRPDLERREGGMLIRRWR